ncbi:MAG TPA: DUF3106 domain-containing protein [Planctomycetes bacterium]|nr:DUF3106 domain-containing protein [Planctomycetota bacterium]HIK60606.1 DUF3106 domain-containing protein [Planctomycetota bacterium]
MSTPRTMGRLLSAAVLASCFSLATAAWAGSDQDAVRNPDQGTTSSKADLRKRFESLSEEQKQALRQRLERLKKLPAQERQELRAQADQLEDMSRRVYRNLADRDRERLDSLSADKRQDLLREMALAEARDMGRRILRKLPQEERERLEAAEPQERQRLLLELRHQMDSRIGQTIERMAPELGFSAEQVKKLNNLPSDERRGKFLHMVKRRCTQYVDGKGLPEGLEAERWEEVKQLPPDEFYLALLNLRRKFPGLARAMNSKPGPDSEGSARRLSPEMQRVRRAMEAHLDPTERLELAEKGRVERERELKSRGKKRAMAALAKGGYVMGEDLKRLEALPDEVFFTLVRRFLDSGGKQAPLPTRSPKERSKRSDTATGRSGDKR